MSNITVPADQAPEVFLFKGRPPLLVVPAVIILALSIAYAPGLRKHHAAVGDSKKLSVKRILSFNFSTLSHPISVIMQLINVFCVCGMYLQYDEPPMMLDTPALTGTGILHSTVAAVAFSVLWTTITSGCYQVSMVSVYYSACKESSQRCTRMLYSLLVLALFPFGWALGSLVAISHNWRPERTAIQNIELILLGQLSFIAFDILLTVAFWRLRREVAPDKKPRLSRLLHIADITYNVSLFLLNLMAVSTFIFGVPLHGWLDYTIELGIFITGGNMHVISLFVMLRALEDLQVAAGATDLAHENFDPIAAAENAVMMVEV